MTLATRNLFVGVAVLALMAAAPQAASAQGLLRATLNGTDIDPSATGSASFVNHGRSVRLELDVQGVTYSNDVLVVVNGSVLVEMSLVGGFDAIELEVEHFGTGFYYQPPQAPPILIKAGDEIDVIDAIDGTLILVGVFG